MDISRADLLRLEQLMATALGDTQLEFEWKYKGPLNQATFMRVISALKDDGFIQNPEAVEMLDISLDNMRYHLQGKGRIQSFCKSGRITGIGADIVDVKTPVNDGTVDIINAPVRVSLRREVTVTDPSEIQAFIRRIEDQTNVKYFRYKKRYSMMKPGGSYRVDATVVKSSPTKAVSFATSGVIPAKETFELEIELINQTQAQAQAQTKPKTKTRLVQEGAGYMHIALNALATELKEANLRNKTLVEYLQLTAPGVSAENARKTPGRYFIGPKNIALEMNALETIGLPQPVYCVTEKTDGERALLYVDSNNVCWRIDNRLNVDATELKYTGGRKCIIDGEYVKGNELVDVFYIFDVYYIEGVSMLKKPLLGPGGRMNMIDLSAFAPLTSPKPLNVRSIKVFAKQFDVATETVTIFQRAKDILDRHNAGGGVTAIDGLIFTPIDAPKDLKDLGSRTYKWKPPQDNTIDFIVRFDKNAILQLGDPARPHVLVQLLVGSKKSRDIIDPIGIITRMNTEGDDAYVPRVFEICYLPLDADNMIRTHEARPEVITNGMVVEMGVMPNIDDRSIAWFPKRIRHDKNELLARQAGSISGTANDFQVAYKTLQTIENPVTYDMITGKKPIPSAETAQDDVYYTKTLTHVQRQSSPMIALRDFHSWIKGTLLQTYAGKRLFDIGVGRAGDLQKWMRAKIDTVLGIDVAANNILGTTKKDDIYDVLTMEDCAYRRYQSELTRFAQLKQQNRRSTPVPKSMFLIMDAGKLWTDEYISSLSHKTNRHLAEIVFGITSASDIKEKLLREQWRGIVDRPGFDVVSCQFAIHYFFKDDSTLSDFCENVSRTLKVGGHFIGTCMDGQRVHSLLSQSANGSIAAYQDPVLQKGMLWEIRRDYGTRAFNHADPMVNIGMVITNYIETIGAHIQEYLVDMRLLEAKLAIHNIVLVKTDLFADLHDAYKNANPSSIMDDKLLNYSFLNRQFVFKKMR
jgi:hypothetical protein